MRTIRFSTPLQNIKYSNNVKKLLDSKKSLHGPGENILKIKKDLKKQFGFEHVHLTNSCTASMEICALMLNLKKNDEVLMPSYNYNTTASSFVRTGCKIRYCDIKKENLLPSFNDFKKNVNKNTKVIIVIHMQGLGVDYLDKLQSFCKKKKIFLIEDAAPALGTYVKKKPVGSYGDFATFSFHETKNYQSGIGGLLVVNNKKFRKQSDLVFDKGTDRTYVVSDPNYHKKYYSWVAIGSCFRLPELNASFLQPQIRDINKVISYREKLFQRYFKNFSAWLDGEFTICNTIKHKYKYNYHAFTIILNKNEREKFLKYLKKNNVIAFISFEALHLSKMGKKWLTRKTSLKNTNEIIKKIIRLPMHNKLTIREVDYVSQKVKDYFNKKNI
jgi:dTDP-4-amino-4,6-dideoxygalactose transaminase